MMAMAEVSPDPAFDSPSDPSEDTSKPTNDVQKLTDFEASQLGLLELVAQLQWRHVIARLKESPEEASTKHSMTLDGAETEGYPMHLAVSLKPPTHAVQALLDAYPNAIKIRDEKLGRLPLHIACIYTASAQVLKILLERHEESLRITDKVNGRLPLHFACMYGSPFEISLLVGAEQRALVFKDADGKTPMDLAHESENPHREAILKRLEDRTRVVTSAMIQRRKQQQQEHPKEKRRNMLRKTDSSRSKTSFYGGGSNDSLEPTNYGTSSRARSMSSNAVSTNDVKKSHISSSSKKRSSDEHRQKVRAKPSQTVDDSDIGKKSKSSKKKREHRVNRMKDEWRANVPSKPVEDPVDIDMTPKQRNGRASLRSSFQVDSSDETSQSTSKQKTVQRHTQLAMFLQATSLDDSSDDDIDHMSMGARSLPAHMHSSTAKPRRFEADENKRIAKSYMFDTDSSDDIDLDSGSNAFRAFTSKSSDHQDSASSASHQRVNSGLSDLDKRLRDLDVRRTALMNECQSIHATIAKKEDEAQQSRANIATLQKSIAEFQERLRREQAALTLSETGIQLQKETMAVHEIKIMAVDSEKTSLLEKRSRMEEDRQSNGLNSD